MDKIKKLFIIFDKDSNIILIINFVGGIKKSL